MMLRHSVPGLNTSSYRSSRCRFSRPILHQLRARVARKAADLLADYRDSVYVFLTNALGLSLALLELMFLARCQLSAWSRHEEDRSAERNNSHTSLKEDLMIAMLV